MSFLDEYYAFYDDEIGVVWNPEIAFLKKTSVNMAKLLEKYLSQARVGVISNSDKENLIEYLKSNLDESTTKVQIYHNAKLTETNVLERLEIVLATKCNLKCKYCYANGGDYHIESELLSKENAKRYVDAIIAMGYSSINTIQFFGGEPLLAIDCLEYICEYISQLVQEKKLMKIPQYTMVTNGTIITQKVCDTIKMNRIHVTVSCDGPMEINDQLRVYSNGDGSYADMLKGVNLLRKNGIDISLIEATYTRIHEKNGISRRDVKKIIQENVCDCPVIVADCEDGTEQKQLLCETWPDECLLSNYGRKRIVELLTKKKTLNTNCGSGYSSFVITPRGYLYPCHFMIGKKEYCMGNYQDNSFNLSGYEAFLKDYSEKETFRNEACKKCFAKFTCTVCPAGMIAVSEKDCEIVRNKQKRELLILAKKGGNEDGIERTIE